MKINLIGVHAYCLYTDMYDLSKLGCYRAIPEVLYKINDERVNAYTIDRPIELFNENLDYRILKNILDRDEETTTFFSMSNISYKKMQRIVSKNIHKVVADMIASVIVNIMKDHNQQDENNIFFIEGIESDKIIGRLGYLYLENRKNTFAFVTYKSMGLMTDVLNNENIHLKFDIHYFDEAQHHEETISPIIPNDYMESLIQTVFFNIRNKEEKISPLRCDIFSQGLSKNQIEEKAKDIESILMGEENMTIPFYESNNKSICVRLPRVLYECIQAEKVYSNILGRFLEVK